MTVEDKLEFGGPQWVDRIRRAFEAAAVGAADSSESFSISERYTDPPEHLAPADGQLGWTCRINGSDVAFETSPSEDADVVIVADYTSILPLARLLHSDPASAAAAAAQGARLVADGQLCVTARRQGPEFLKGIHDEMAAVTA